MQLEEILKLIDTVSKSSLTEFEWKEGEMEIKLEKQKEQAAGGQLVIAAAPEQYIPTPAAGPVNVTETVAVQASGEGNVIESPLVGTFYNAPSPEAEVFVKVGDTVKKGQVLGIIEAMKLMNEIESEYDGVVTEVLVENEQMVEYGQPLFRIA